MHWYPDTIENCWYHNYGKCASTLIAYTTFYPPFPHIQCWQVLRTLLSPANIDLGGRGVKIVTNMRNEKYIICLEVFKNLSLFLKSLPIFFS